MTKKIYFIFLIGIVFLMSSFQNCSEQPAVLIKRTEHSKSSRLSLRTSICPEVSFMDDEHNNFLFVMDMSRSNIGRFEQQPPLCPQYPYYWDSGFAKDPDGQRFDAVKNFIDSCAGLSNNKFAVIGFSTDAGQLLSPGPYGCSPQPNRPKLDCSDPIPFVEKEAAKRALDQLKTAHEFEKAHHWQWIRPNSYMSRPEPPSCLSIDMIHTSYSKAAKCSNEIINGDLRSSFEEDVDNYHIIFISDGRPKDYDPCSCKCKTGQKKTKCEQEKPACYVENPSCERLSDQAAKDDCYTKGALNPFKSSVHEVGAIGRNVNMITVGYGLTNQGDYHFLDELARITRENGRAERLDSFQGNTNVLCDLISSRFGVETNSDSLMSVVLTLNHRNGAYKSDSDMDGLLDEDEEALSYNPANPRSQVSGVLDGLCEKIGGIASCHRAMEGVTCDANLLRSDGFSDCDVKLIKSHWESLNLDDSSDWDKDGLPNFIEIVKGTDPFVKDMSEDPDNDLVNTRTEIMHSKNPFEHESLSPPDLPKVVIENEFSTSITPQCPRRVRHLILKEVPFIESQAVNVGMIGGLLHGVNEHVVAVFSSRKTQNYLLQNKGMIGKYVKLEAVQENGQWILVPSVTELTNNELESWDVQ